MMNPLQVESYAGILTAMITRPALHMPVRNVEGLLGQDEMSWVVEDGIGVVEYMKVLIEIYYSVHVFPTTMAIAFYFCTKVMGNILKSI